METSGLYAQIPFCASKCSFCNFSSQVAPAAVYDGYVESLEREILLRAEAATLEGVWPGREHCPFDTIYFGGGTPTLLGADKLGCVFRSLYRHFDLKRAREITMEMAPGSASRHLLECLLTLGVNRLSVGAQSFEDRELRATGRLHSAVETVKAIQEARSTGFRNVNVDLIAGLPYQSKESWNRSLRALARLEPEHVSIYLFEADEKSRLGRELMLHGTNNHAAFMPGEEFMACAYEEACEFLAREGYEHYEISNFARPGFESAHNLKYWRREPYLGLGAGAHSFDGQQRWANETDPANYQARLIKGELPMAETRVLDPAAAMEEYFFLGLRELRGVSLEHARREWDAPPLNGWMESAERLQHEGLLQENEGRLMLTERAYLVSNEVFQDFLV